jgi:tetratricopeptide (TPR) repeat protein
MVSNVVQRLPAASDRRRASRLARRAALLVLLQLGAGALAEEPCSLAGGARWREYRSRHFVIDVAGELRDPARLVAAFEDLHAAVLAALIAEPVEIPAKVRVLVFPRQRDLYDYTGSRDILGLFWVSALGEPSILMSADQVDEVPQVVAHELVHYISSYLFPRQPYWFSEGLAQFLEGVGKADREGRRWAGGDPTGGWLAGSVKLTRMETLLDGGHSSDWGDSPYLTSWVLYRFLWNERSRQLSEYQRRLMDGASPADAWRAAFPEWDMADGKSNLIDGWLSQHQQRGRGVRWEIKLGAVDQTFTTAQASPGDVHLALLPRRQQHVNERLQGRVGLQALEEAEREDPGHPIVVSALTSLRKAPLLPALRECTKNRPTDGRGWYLLGREAVEPEEREAALRNAVKHWPEGALAQAALASHLAATGRARAALGFANRAVELAPWNPVAVSTLAAVAVELRQCPEALALQQRAIEAAEPGRNGAAGDDLAQLRSQLAEMRKRCAAAPGPR